MKKRLGLKGLFLSFSVLGSTDETSCLSSPLYLGDGFDEGFGDRETRRVTTRLQSPPKT